MEKKNQLRSYCKKMLSSPNVSIGDLQRTRRFVMKQQTTCVEDSRLRPSGMTGLFYHGNNAFTLIELLVVVLIIGILAAVALPQYQKAVAKARLATIKPIMASLKNAEEAYYLANNTYTSDGSNLDIESSCEATNDPGVFICGKYFVVDLISGNLTPGSSKITAYYCPGHTNPWETCTTTYKDLIYHVWLSQSSYPDTIQCTPYTATGTALCKVIQQ